MQRRKFLQGTFIELPSVLFASTTMASCNDSQEEIQPNGKRVIVVGGGISGLATAKKLKENGFSVLLLESQDRVGGRIRTSKPLDLSFDEGASWIHGSSKNPITELAEQSGATTYVTDDDNVTVFDFDGRVYPDDFLTREEKLFDNSLQTVENTGTENQSFETVFTTLFPNEAKNRLWKYMLSSYLEFNTGGDISSLSSKYFYDDEEFGGKDVLITNGYDSITNYLADGTDIRLQTNVTEIDFSKQLIQIKASNTVFECDYVVVTVPLGVLKQNKIEFIPALPPEKTSAIERVQMGVVNKFLLTWDSAFWDITLDYIGFTPEMKGKFPYFLNFKKITGKNALITFALGNYAKETEEMSDQEVVDEIMSNLRAMYGKNIPNPTQIFRTKWGKDRHTFGSYSFATNGTTSKDFDTLGASLFEKVFFAGEHTHRSYRGTVHGAYLSGIREADKLIQLVK